MGGSSPHPLELKRLTVGGFLEIALVISVVLPAVLGAYAVFAVRPTPRGREPPQYPPRPSVLNCRWMLRSPGI